MAQLDADGTRINGVIPGAGTCPVCHRETDQHRLACRECWQYVGRGLRTHMSEAWTVWHLGGSLADLREAQRRVIRAIEERRPA